MEGRTQRLCRAAAGSAAAHNILWEDDGHADDAWFGCDNAPATLTREKPYELFGSCISLPAHLRGSQLQAGWWLMQDPNSS